MAKRKRDNEGTAEQAVEGDGEVGNPLGRNGAEVAELTTRRLHLIGRKISLFERKLKAVIKVAARYEHQKLVKRLRRADQGPITDQPGRTAGGSSSVPDRSKIEPEMEALRTIDTQKTAIRQVRRLVGRHKQIASRLRPALPDLFTEIPDAPSDPAAANIQARLLNSNRVKMVGNELVGIIESICLLSTARPARVESVDGQVCRLPTDRSTPVLESDCENEPNLAAGDTVMPDLHLSDSEDGPDLLALADAQSKEWSDSSDAVDVAENRLPGPARCRSVPTERNSAGRAKSRLSDDSTPTSDNDKAGPDFGLAADKTVFFPSLSMHGYMSNSDTESWSGDSDGEAVGSGPTTSSSLTARLGEKKKNRRGQRARQAIWERKYGAKAAHVVRNNQATDKDRNAGWDPRRGAQAGRTLDRGRGGGSRLGRTRANTGDGGDRLPGRGQTGPSEPTESDRRKRAKLPDRAEMHPSWIAKRDSKERQKTISAAAMAGVRSNQKIVFD